MVVKMCLNRHLMTMKRNLRRCDVNPNPNPMINPLQSYQLSYHRLPVPVLYTF